MVKMEINSIRLHLKLVLEFTENGSADINISPNGNRTPKHGKVLNIYLSEVEIFLFREHLVTHLLTSFGKKYSGKDK